MLFETILSLYFQTNSKIVIYMDLEFFILNGYGIFVWPAFIFTFLSCFYLFAKTKKEFHKCEEVFIKEFKKPEYISVRANEKGKIQKEILSSSSI